MHIQPDSETTSTAPILVLGSTGKTGRRVVTGLKALNLPYRAGSRSGSPAFDWDREATWDACLEGIRSVYLTYSPDLAMPGAPDAIAAFVEKARRAGVRRIVLLSGRGEIEAQRCEAIVQESGLEWTIVRASWFHQNFSEGAFCSMVHAGAITLPESETPEPFVDVDDIADVALAALTEDSHVGEVYEVTGPELLTLDQLAQILTGALGREIRNVPLPHDAFIASLQETGAPKDVVWMLDYLFATVLDGRNASLCDGVQRALGRPPKSFGQFAKETAATGIWEQPAESNHPLT